MCAHCKKYMQLYTNFGGSCTVAFHLRNLSITALKAMLYSIVMIWRISTIIKGRTFKNSEYVLLDDC